MVLALLLLLSFDSPAFAACAAPALLAQDKQDKVEMTEFKTSYLVVRPASYSDRESWPVIVDLNTGKDPIREPDCFVLAPGERKDEAYVLACLADLKTKFRVNPETV